MTLRTRFRQMQSHPDNWSYMALVLGVGLRLYHYLRAPSMWHDEAALVVNVLGKGFRGLLGPLFLHEAAPPLFLWCEKGMVLALGDGVYALRLIPFLASCGALILMWLLARSVLRPAETAWALLLFACSDRLLWHACEAKPYSVDVFAAVLILYLFHASREWPLLRRLILFALVSPVLIVLVYPGCFVCGGLLLAFFPTLRGCHRRQEWFGYGILALAICAACSVLMLGPAHAQRSGPMEQCWLAFFPRWDRPWTVPFWSLWASVEVVDYCFRPLGGALFALAAAGSALLWRRGYRGLMLASFLPILLALLASYLRLYPYGGARILVFALPALTLMIGAAAPAALCRLQRRSRAAAAALLLLLLAPLGLSLWRAVSPWRRADSAGAAAYVLARRRPADPVASEQWQYRYYFRHLGPAFHPQVQPLRPVEGRLWIVLSEQVSASQRQAMLRALMPDPWRVIQEREFVDTSVALFATEGN